MPINLRHFRPRAANERPTLDLAQSQCWEDEELVVEHLGGPGRVGAVIEGADSVLALALSGAEVLAWGGEGERALLELKLAGAKLRHPEYLQLLGLLEAGRRVILYHQVREDLSPSARRYWDRNEATVRVGILQLGGFERELTRLRKRVLPLAMGARFQALLQVPNLDKQQELLAELRRSKRWRALDRVAPPGLVQGVERALAQRLIHQCGPLLWLLLGHYPRLQGCGRRYLLPENFEALQGCSERVHILEAPPDVERVHLGHQPLAHSAAVQLSWGVGQGEELGGIALRGAGRLKRPGAESPSTPAAPRGA